MEKENNLEHDKTRAVTSKIIIKRFGFNMDNETAGFQDSVLVNQTPKKFSNSHQTKAQIDSGAEYKSEPLTGKPTTSKKANKQHQKMSRNDFQVPSVEVRFQDSVLVNQTPKKFFS